MKLAVLAGALALAAVAQAKEPMKLTPEALNADASLSGPSVRGAAVSPDGKLVTILKGRPDDARQLDLWAYDIATGKARMLVSSTDLVGEKTELSAEEKNRRERQRIYDYGIIDYQWDQQAKQILFPLGGDVFVYDLAAAKATRVTKTDAFETDAKFSEKGGYVSYVRGDELYVYDLAAGKERKITSGAGGTIRNAVAEFVAQEELSRDTGYWWSPDDSKIAFTQIDESPVPVVDRLEISADKVETVAERYPFAGADNVTIKLAVTTPKGGKPVWIDLGKNTDIYLARVYWSADSSKLYVVRLSRDQKTLDFLEANPATGATKDLFTETSKTWINLSADGFKALHSGGFIWSSERSGFRQLYRYAADGALVGAVTSGPGLVDSLDCVDEETGLIYYGGWRTSPIERHLFSVPLAGGEPTQLTTQPGWHEAEYAKNCKTAIRRFSSDNQPPQEAVYDASGKQQFWLNENKVEGDHPYAPYMASHLPWAYGQLNAADGTPLDYKILKPKTRRGEKLPAIILVYGGPHAQMVRNVWGDLLAQMLADNGYVVFRLDNRGANNRGKAFEDTLYRSMGTTEVEDQAVGAKFLKSLPYVDGKRIGVHGWSYGGYMTLRMLTATPDLYAAGAAGAPVTDWSLYDTAYTERYMGKPQDEKDAYARGSAFADLDKLKAHLLVLHGMADDNVIFMNSVKLMSALQKAGKEFELMTYPGEKHGFRATADKIHRDRMILDFFNRHLKGEGD